MPGDTLTTLLAQRDHFLRFIQRRIPDGAVAEDILQSAYIRALQHEGALQAQESAAGWFYRVLRNAVIDQYRRRTSEDKALAEWGREMERDLGAGKRAQAEVCACLLGAIDGIKPSYAEVLRAVDLGEQTLADFARQQNISLSNAGVRAHRARAALRRRLVRVCGACAEHSCVDCSCRRAGTGGRRNRCV